MIYKQKNKLINFFLKLLDIFFRPKYFFSRIVADGKMEDAIFFCYDGKNKGEDFVSQAINNGAKVIVCNKKIICDNIEKLLSVYKVACKRTNNLKVKNGTNNNFVYSIAGDLTVESILVYHKILIMRMKPWNHLEI